MRVTNNSLHVDDADATLVELLRRHGLMIPASTDENATFEIYRQQHVHNSFTVKSKVLVTRRCNNRCRYCIIDAEPMEMSRETARAIDRFYLECIRESGARKVADEYSGGEPLLNAEIIMESAERRFHYCLGRGIDYGFTIITNGTLLRPALIHSMKEIGLSGIRVSLAGPAAVHDRLRPSSENGKTYDLILGNLQEVSGLTPITIECQYDAGSEDHLKIPAMFDDFETHRIGVENVFFTPILPGRNTGVYGGGAGDPEIMLKMMHEAEHRGYPQWQEPPSNCCSADFRSRFVFDTDGSLIPCPVLQSGEMVYGHVATGIDFIAHAQILQRRLPGKCLEACELLPLCLGGCRLHALVHGDGFNGVDCRYESLRLMIETYMRVKAEQGLSGVMTRRQPMPPDDHDPVGHNEA